MSNLNHINVYSKSESELGRLLSNFAHTPFVYAGRMYASVEGWWYFRRCPDPRLLALHGWAAKKLGQALERSAGSDPTPAELLDVYLAKVDQNPYIKQLLVDSSLPFDHYYEYGGKRVYPRHRWTGQLWSEVREIVKQTR